jgi:hypothetical protein
VAGLGYRAFTGGSVLTAAQVQGYLQDQAVMKFASATARDAALTPVEGMVCYLADSSAMFSYDGANWVVIPQVSEYVSSAPYSIASPTSAFQNIYAASNTGASLAANMTYEVEGVLRVQYTITSTPTLANFQMTYSGTAASSYFFIDSSKALTTFDATLVSQAKRSFAVNASAACVESTSSVATVCNTVFFKGIIRTSSTGTLTPQYGFNNTIGLTGVQSQANSYFKVTPLGSSSMTNAGTFA